MNFKKVAKLTLNSWNDRFIP